MIRRTGAVLALAGLAVATSLIAHAAATRQSATFDEIILVSGGVRGTTHGLWEMVTDQPPLMMYAYGWAARSAGPELPPEDRAWTFDERWTYARLLFFGSGDDPRTLLGRARAVSAVAAGLLVAAAGAFSWWIAGPWVGVLGAALTMSLPDVLAHGGVAYNDLPLALAFLLAVWALEAAVRRPSIGRGAVAGVAVAAALGIKLSALALLPLAVALVAAEGSARGKDVAWGRPLAFATAAGALGSYLALVVLYRGDATLTLFRFNFWRTVLHASGGHPAPAYLLGATSQDGWWYYFPLSFFFKTPAALHALLLVAVVGAVAAWRERTASRHDAPATGAAFARRERDREAAWRESFRDVASWRGRAPFLGLLVFGAFLLRSDLNAGFRYALPALPLLTVLVAVGAGRVAGRLSGSGARATTPAPTSAPRERGRRAARAAVYALVALQAVSVLSFHPHYLAYSSLWAGGRDGAWRVLADSSLDWGQGLLELRRFMDEEGVDRVRLSYFGSAIPDAYGIDYIALPSFFRLDGAPSPRADTETAAGGPTTRVRFTAISATNLVGLYLQGRDPFASYRDRAPYRVLGHSILVYEDP